MTATSNADSIFPETKSDDQHPNIAWAILAVLLAIGATARFAGAASRSMFDDAASWTFATLPWDSFWKVIFGYEANMVAYYLLLREWVHFGDSEIVLRSLSILFGVATIAIIYALGSRLFNRRTGLIAAQFLAVHALHIEFSQRARSYSLTTFLLLLSTLLLVTSLKTRSRLAWAGYVTISALACYAHFLSALVLASQWLWLASFVGLNQVRAKIGVLVTLAIAVAPIGVFAITKNSGQVDWVSPLNRYNFVNTMTSLAGEHTLLLFLYLALCALAGLFAYRSRQNIARTSGTSLTLVWAIFPIAALTSVSLLKPMLVDRYLLMCLPAILLLAAATLDELLAGNRAMKTTAILAGLTIVSLSSYASVAQYKNTISRPNALREMTAYIAQNNQVGDAAIFYTAATHLSFRYYATRLGEHDKSISVPEIIVPNFGEAPTGAQPIPSSMDVKAATMGYNRVWLILNQGSIRIVPGAKEGLPHILEALDDNFVLNDENSFERLIVRLYVRRKT